MPTDDYPPPTSELVTVRYAAELLDTQVARLTLAADAIGALVRIQGHEGQLRATFAVRSTMLEDLRLRLISNLEEFPGNSEYVDKATWLRSLDPISPDFEW